MRIRYSQRKEADRRIPRCKRYFIRVKKKSRLRFKPDELPENAAPKEEAPKAPPTKKEQQKPQKPDKATGKTGKRKDAAPKKKADAPKLDSKAVPKEKALPPTTLHFEENRPKRLAAVVAANTLYPRAIAGLIHRIGGGKEDIALLQF